MDEERRQRENYKSRLMDGNEVPDWVFANNNETITKKTLADEYQDIMVGSKRRRKEVVYADSFGDQWMKSDDGFEDIPKITPRAKRTAYSSDIQGVDFSERRKRSRSLENSADGSSNPAWTPEKGRDGVSSYSKDENEDDGDDEVITSSLQNGSSFTWKTLGRKRSNHFNSSSDSKGRPSF
uniref:Snf2 ATP coupling domain-containing protein n=1 Tax=Arundo donax TaxID=35708 RepID=A0A0A9FHS8_ARUDO